jgi:hypothetical protein
VIDVVLRAPVLIAAMLATGACAPAAYSSEIKPLPASVKTLLKTADVWHKGCPVGLSDLRLLTVTHRDFAGQQRMGQLVVNKRAAVPLANVFKQLYHLRFPIRHLSLADAYGPAAGRPRDGDVSGSFSCRQAVPSPCTGGRGTGTWSMHAYGLAIDVNPLENPYVGCGQSRDPAAKPYFDRSRLRRGMVTQHVITAFRSIDWGWGGAWTGNTKDYMHFSSSGH